MSITVTLQNRPFRRTSALKNGTEVRKTSIFGTAISVINGISKVISACYFHKKLFRLTGLFATRKFPTAKTNHRYGILVAARNEEAVIGKLVESINNQDYPRELIRIFVVAHNCTDDTAAAARKAGAVCYEYNDENKRTKGFALQYLVEQIRRDFGVDCCEGYLIFDADNLLKEDFMTRMNESFDAGETIVASYRNTKNFDDNWISASYGIHWLRTIRNEHRARSVFHLATRIQGTGFLFPWEVIKDGWKYTSLTEDRAFCADVVTMGYRISYNNDAEFFDEQPTDIKIAMRQRLRWSKGHLDAFVETGGKLFCNIFRTRGAANKDDPNAPLFKRILRNIRFRLINFDMLTVVFPRSVTLTVKKLAVAALKTAWILATANTVMQTFGIGYAPDLIRGCLKLIGIHQVFPQTVLQALVIVSVFSFAWTVNTYIETAFNAAIVLILEQRRIKKMRWYRQVWFCITFPIFDLIGKLTTLMALFMKVDWKPIPHKVAIGVDKVK